MADHDPASEDPDREDRRRQPQSSSLPCIRAIAYIGGRSRAADEIGIDFTRVPADCPFTIDRVLDPAFMPDRPDPADQS